MKEKYAKFLLDKTQQNYNRIAEHFAKTRSYVWSDLEYLKKFVKANDKILDLGCGNARLLKLLKHKNIDYVGVDNSEKLIEIAKNNWRLAIGNWQLGKRQPKFLIGSALDLPFEKDLFDKVFSIAVLHHIPSKKFRLRFLKEAKRVLKPNGLLIITVWNLWKFNCLNFQFKHIFLKLTGKSKLDFKDIFYPWKSLKGEILVQRYIHCFTKRELKRLAKKAGFKIKEIGFLGKQKRNIYLIARKINDN